MDVAGVDGLVVLVDADDHLLAVAAVEIAREIEQRALIDRSPSARVERRAVIARLVIVEATLVEQVAVLDEEGLDLAPERVPRGLPARRLDALERQVDDGISLE